VKVNEEAEGIVRRLRELRAALLHAARAIQDASLTQRRKAELADEWRRIAGG
jgi:hypothetical protein